MTKNIQRNVESIAIQYQPYVSRTAALFAVVLTASVFLYSAFLLEAVAHAAAKTTATHQLQSIKERLGTLESQYLAMTQSLTPEKAAELGFVTPAALATVYTHGESGALSFGGR